MESLRWKTFQCEYTLRREAMPLVATKRNAL
jgi:hypothetical protein